VQEKLLRKLSFVTTGIYLPQAFLITGTCENDCKTSLQENLKYINKKISLLKTLYQTGQRNVNKINKYISM